MSLLLPILAHAITSPRRLAVIDDQRRYTYMQIAGGAMFVADRIDASTDARHVGIILPTGGTFPMALLGAWLAGRVAVPLNYLLAKDELAYVIKDSGIDTIFTVGPMLTFLGGPEVIPPGVRLIKLEELDFTGLPPLRVPPLYNDDDLAVILYTSGTSGRPKGVMLTHGNLHSNVDAGIEHAHMTEGDTFLGVLPQFHSFGLTALTLIPLRMGAKTVYSARFVPRRVVELIRKHHPHVMMAVPSMYGALLSVKEAGPEDFASVRLAVSGGEPLPEVVAESFESRFGVRLLEGYGLTETAPVANWSTPWAYRPRSVGLALPGVRIFIVDGNGHVLPPHHEGEIILAGPNVMKGYYHLPQQTAEVFMTIESVDGSFRGRGFRTGDIGKLDDQGFLYITGRKKEMLIIGGENLFPREVEEILNKHPSVRDSAVIGKTDGLRGEVPVAFVEIHEGQSFDESALRTWCRDRLAGYKVPREIRSIEQLPRSPTGKVLRRQLKST